MPDLATDLRDYFDAMVEPLVDDVVPRARELPLMPPTEQPPRRWLAVAALFVLIAGVLSAHFALRGGERTPDVAITGDPAGGAWSALPVAPIDPNRARPVAVWTGTEMIVWGGTNLTGTLALASGAAYDPATQSWRDIAGPDWGHPGLAGAYLDDQLFLVAKDGGARVDVGTGESTALPFVDGFTLTGAVAAGQDLWVIGPSNTVPGEPTELRTARYEPGSDTWDPGPSMPNPQVVGGDLLRDAARSPIWTGSEIVVWTTDGHGFAFDPVSRSWRSLPDLEPTSGSIATSTITATDERLVAVAQVDDQASTTTQVAVLDSGTWRWLDLDLPSTDLDVATVAPAGEWVMLLHPTEGAVVIDPSASTWHRTDSEHVRSQYPGTVWTGDQLLVWGGVGDPSVEPSPGAAWTPRPRTAPPTTPDAAEDTSPPFADDLVPGWHDIDTGPVPAVESPTMAWTGAELFVGVGPTMVYALDASTGVWTHLPALPDAMGSANRPPALVATDVGVVAVEDSFELAGSALWDGETDRWVDLGEIHVADNLAAVGTGMHAQGSWGGGPALVWTGEAVLDLYHGAVWSPTIRAWTALPGPTDVLGFTGLLYTNPVWDGHEVVAAAWSTVGGLAWNASGTEYREIPGLPAQFSDPTGAGRPWSDDALATVVDGRVFLLSGTEGSLAASFDSHTDTWTSEPRIGVGYGGEGCPAHVAATADGPIAQPCFNEQRFALVGAEWRPLQGGPDGSGTTWLTIDGRLLIWGITSDENGYVVPTAHLWVPPTDWPD